MTSLRQHSGAQDISARPLAMRAETHAKTTTGSICLTYDSQTRVDIALLVSALFLQRFGLPFGQKAVSLDLVAAAFILGHQFISGKLFVQYDRLLWFLGIALVATCSLLLNLEHASVTAYSQFLVFCCLFTLTRTSTDDQYKRTLHAFQVVLLLLACLSVLQFVAQFVVSGYQLVMFFGLIPPILLDLDTGAHTAAITGGSSLLRSNAIFLAEPSNLTQIMALGILIEVLEFRRPHYLVVMVVGMLLAYTGAGWVTLAVFLPLASLRHGKVAFSVMFIIVLALGLFATGTIDSSVFLSRADEFGSPGSSGHGRFVGPFWVANKFFNSGSLEALLVGVGPGGNWSLENDPWGYNGMSAWLKQLVDYGIIGSFIFICFAASCLRKSRCPGLLLAAVIFYDLAVGTYFTPWVSIVTVVLCTLQHRGPRRDHSGTQHDLRPALAAAAG